MQITFQNSNSKKDICDVTEEDLGEYDGKLQLNHTLITQLRMKPFVKTNIEGTYNLLELARKIQSYKSLYRLVQTKLW